MAILEVQDLTFVRNNRIILDIEGFSLNEGEVTSLIGANGAGKTTLLLIMALLQEPNSGKIIFSGVEVSKNKLRDFRQRMAFVFQQPLLLNMTVRENIEIGLRLRKIPRPEINRRVDYWMQRLGIKHLANGTVCFLSGGEAQRVSIARALAMEPEVLFLDEPFTGLDSPTRGQLLLDLAGLLHGTRIATMFVTHDYNEIPYIAHRLAVIDQGRIIQTGPPENIINQPINEKVSNLLRWLPHSK